MGDIVLIGLLFALGMLLACVVLAIWVGSQVIDDEELILNDLERKHGLRDNE